MVLELPDSISLQCVFCMATAFVMPCDDYQPKSCEMLVCANCGRSNDYDSLMRVATENAMEIMKERTEKALKDAFKKAGFTIK